MIVGMGPAGCAAAVRARRLRPDWKILLVERLDQEKHAIYHRMCGEGISAAGLKELDYEAGPHIVHRITKAVERWPGGITVTSPIDGYIIDRPGLLRSIKADAEKKGATYITGNVANVKQGDEAEVVLEDGSSHSARWLIAADGARSKVRAEFFGTEPKQMIWADQYVLAESMEQDVIEFVYDEKYAGGYLWRFPSGNRTRMGFPKGSEDAPENALETHRRAIPVGEVPELVKGRVALVGDAGALVNPITFGGIRIAFASGRMAAEAAVLEDLPRYQNDWKGSKYVRASFWRGYEQLCAMSNAQLEDAMAPFRKGYTLTGEIRAMLTKRQYREVYRSFALSMKVGW
jgi:flavin-dependent dehydrogenase